MTTAIDARTVQREEAMRRLKALRLHENVVRDFASVKLNLSERAVFPGNRKKPFGILYWLNEGEKRAVEEFEAEYKAVVYHVMKYNTEFGTQYAMLYVSKYEEEWEMDREDLKEGSGCAFVTDGFIEELGLIGFKESGGGLVRVW